MSTHRAVALLAGFLFIVAFAPAAGAQNGTDVSLTLLHQTPWSSLKEPELRIAVRAENTGTTRLDDLTLVLTLGIPVRTRGTYDQSLTSGPDFAIRTLPVPVDGSLGAGQVRTIPASLDLSTVFGISRTESLIYPMLVDLRSGGLPTGAELRTPVLFFVKKPLVPLAFAWTVELGGPPAFGPSGTLANTSIEAQLAPGGTLRAEIDALGFLAQRRVPVDLVVNPLLVQTLARMAAGYRIEGGPVVAPGSGGSADAAAALGILRKVVAAKSTQVVALPFAAPLMPAILSSPLAKDLPVQVEEGRRVVSDVLGVQPVTQAARPPGGAVDQAAVDSLASGASVLLLDAAAVRRAPDPLGFLQSPLVSIVAGGGHPVAALVPDAQSEAALSSGTDPVQRAQAALGELMAAWQEHPGDSRAITVSLTDVPEPARFWEAFAPRIEGAPFLTPVHADEMVRMLAGDAGLPAPSPLAETPMPSFSRAYTEAIRRTRRDVRTYASMLAEPSQTQALLEDLLVAESGVFVGDETAGRAWIDGVAKVTGAAFAATQPTPAQLFTLTSSSGTIPIRLGQQGDQGLKVVVQLSSSRLRFPEGSEQPVTLSGPDQIILFRVEAQGTGRIPVTVTVRAPSGRPVSSVVLFVRSTAYNRIALVVTLVAALGLVALWARRFFRRPS